VADISKLRQVRGLGDPPTMDEGRDLSPAAAPVLPVPSPPELPPQARAPAPPIEAKAPAPAAARPSAEPATQLKRDRPLPPPSDAEPRPRIDARTLRRTGRTIHFATKVTEAYDYRVREIAAQTGKYLSEILEESLAAYEREIQRSDNS